MAVDSGDTIAEKYVLNEKVGEDEFGSWYMGENSESQDQVMIKIMAPRMHADEEARNRFIREIELLAKIRHQGIATCLEAGEENGTYFMISEYQEGINLSEYMQNQGVIAEKDAVNLMINVVEALQYAWDSENIVHRDIKPTKIFITDDNQVKICDLGLAKSMSDDTMDLTGAGFTVGTPDYISPEQAAGEEGLDFRADMYSLGLVLYEMVTGQKAFEGPVMEVLNRQMTDMPTPAMEVNTKVTSRCNTLIEKMIQKSRDDRFSDWAELLEAMHLLLDTTVMESDLQIFDVNDLTDGDDEPSLESLTADDDGAFGAPKVNASGIIMEEDVADNEASVNDEAPSIDAIEPGTIIGNGYEIDRKVGDGSMGEIYLAFSEESDKLVQVKVLPAHMTQDQEKVERFLQEIKITSNLSHPNLLSVIEAGEDNGRYYLVTEYEEGISFHDFIGRYGPLHEKDALSFLTQIAEVLNYAWKEKKLLHREIKPENILIKEETKDAKLTDFGVAKPMTDEALNLTGMGFTIGTPDYMSPEQVRGDEDLDSRSDMYALGLVLYEALTKKKTFEADNVMALMNKQMVEAHTPITKVNSKVSKNCSDLVDRLLCKNREGRFSDWDELIKVMRKVADGGAVPALDEAVDEKSQTSYPAQQTAASPGAQETKSAPAPSKPKTAPPAAAEDKKGNGLLIVGAVVVVVIIVALIFAFK